MTTYTAKHNAVKAARKALGTDAALDKDFTISSDAEGRFAWAPINPATHEEPAMTVTPAALEIAAEFAAEFAPETAAETAPEAPAAETAPEAPEPAEPALEPAMTAQERRQLLALFLSPEAGSPVARLIARGFVELAPETEDHLPALLLTEAGAQAFLAPVAAERGGSRTPRAPREAGQPTKLDRLMALVTRPGGATYQQLLDDCGWNACHTTVRNECAKRGYTVTVEGRGKTAIWSANPAETQEVDDTPAEAAPEAQPA